MYKSLKNTCKLLNKLFKSLKEYENKNKKSK